MTLMEIYTIVSGLMLLYVAMLWSNDCPLNTSIKLAFYITGTVGLVLTILLFIPMVV